MGLLNQMGYVNNGNGWELSPAGKIKATADSKAKIEQYIASALEAQQADDGTDVNFHREWAQRLVDSAFANDFITSTEKSDYESRINSILAP